MASFTQTIGFIGSGRMASALASGCLQSNLVPAEQLIAADPNEAARQSFTAQVPGARLAAGNREVFDQAEIIVLAVKPQIMPAVLSDITAAVNESHLVVSIAAGVTLAKLAAGLSTAARLVRVMPNTPCLVRSGASCYARGAAATEDDGLLVKQILLSVGRAYEVDEEMLDAVTGLSGSGPAFIYRVVEALAEGGQASGLPAELAVELAAQTARGAAEMVLSTGKTPAELREQVTSPGGTTLAGLETLEKMGGPQAFSAAVKAAAKRSKELGQS